MSSGRNVQVDSVRGLAAISVFVFHATNRIEGLYGAPYHFLGHLNLGVRVFFLLSGYFIYRPFVQSHLRYGTGLAIGQYAWKRFWRIYPTYWLALAFAVAVGHTGVEGVSGVLKHGLLVQTYFRDRDGVGIGASWTLVVEVLLYLLIPLFALIVRGLGRVIVRSRAELFAVSFIGLAAAACLAPYSYDTGIFSSPGLPRVLGSAAFPVAIGMMLAVVESIDLRHNLRARITRVASPIGRWWLGAVLVLLLLVFFLADSFANPDRPTKGFEWFNLQWGHSAIAMLLVAPLVLAPDAGGRMRAFLCRRSLVMVGTISFSFYLWHIRVLKVISDLGWFDSLGSAIPAALVAFGVSIGLASLSQRYVEATCAKVAARWPMRVAEPAHDLEKLVRH